MSADDREGSVWINIGTKGSDQATADLDRIGKKAKETGDQVNDSTGKETVEHGKNLTVLGKMEGAIDKVTVRKKQLIGITSQLGQNIANSGASFTGLTTSIGAATANLGPWGLAIGAGIMLIGNLADAQFKEVARQKEVTAAFIENSDAAKAAGDGYIAAAGSLDKLDKKLTDVGSGMAAFKLAGGTDMGKVITQLETSIFDTLKSAAQQSGLDMVKFDKTLNEAKPTIDAVAIASVEIKKADEDLIKAENAQAGFLTAGVGAQLDLLKAQEKQKAAIENYNDELKKLSDKVGFDVTPAMALLQNVLLTQAVPALGRWAAWMVSQTQGGKGTGVVSGARTGVTATLEDWISSQKETKAGGGGTGIKTMPQVSPENAEYYEQQIIAGLPNGLPKGWQPAYPQVHLPEGKKPKAIDTFGKDLAETTANQVANGLYQAFTSSKPKDALKSLFTSVMSSLFSAGAGKLIGMLFGGPALATGGYSTNRGWKPFAGGGDMGSWVSSPMGILGSRGNALVGDVPEVVQNIPQLQRMMGAMQATGGDTYHVYTSGVIGSRDISETVRTNYVTGERSHKKVSRG